MSEQTKVYEKAAAEEVRIAETLLANGAKAATRTKGGRKTNRLKGDVTFRIHEVGPTYSLEAQISPGDGHRKNYTLNVKKVDNFIGEEGATELCYYLFGNDHWKDYVIVAKDPLDDVLKAYTDGDEPDVVIKAYSEYFLISRIGLAHSGLVLASGTTLEECVSSFAKMVSSVA